MGYQFTLVLDRVPTDDELDRLFEAGCADAEFEPASGVSLAHFDRTATSLTAAISSAVHSVEAAGFSASEVRGESVDTADQLGYAREIAAANLMVNARAFLGAQRRRTAATS